jgi:hypothetical protein
MDIKIGADPEFFIQDGNGNLVGAFEFFPGDKHNPYPLSGGSVQVDGFAVEIGIDPTSDINEFDERLISLVEQCKHFIPNDYKFIFSPVVQFDHKYFSSVSDEHKRIGCEPSVNSLSLKNVRPPYTAAISQKRYGGGHIHIGVGEGFDVEDYMTQVLLAKFASNIESGCSFELNSMKDKSYDRLYCYNLSYNIRFKPYGVELRRPSNVWADPKESTYRKTLLTQVLEKAKIAREG